MQFAHFFSLYFLSRDFSSSVCINCLQTIASRMLLLNLKIVYGSAFRAVLNSSGSELYLSASIKYSSSRGSIPSISSSTKNSNDSRASPGRSSYSLFIVSINFFILFKSEKAIHCRMK